jgi:hypothetical protein
MGWSRRSRLKIDGGQDIDFGDACNVILGPVEPRAGCSELGASDRHFDLRHAFGLTISLSPETYFASTIACVGFVRYFFFDGVVIAAPPVPCDSL